MTINLKDNYEDKTIEISIDDNDIIFQWQDENEIWQSFSLNSEQFKRSVKFLEDDKKRL